MVTTMAARYHGHQRFGHDRIIVAWGLGLGGVFR